MFDDELPPEAFRWRFPPKATNTERVRKKRRYDFLKADAELYNRLVAQYGRHVIVDFLIEHGFTARAFIAEETPILDDLDLWFEAAGERLDGLREVERLGLECWLWETHDRSGRLWGRLGKEGARNPDRWKPNKSTSHDEPWPNPPLRWAPRRWFGPCPPGPPLQISISRAVGIRAQLETEFSTEVAHSEGRTEFAAVDAELATRKHPNPGGFYGPEGGFWGRETDPASKRKRIVYQREVDEPPRESVLLQTHEPSDEKSHACRTSPTTGKQLYDAIRRYRLKWEACGRPDYRGWKLSRRVRSRALGRWGIALVTGLPRKPLAAYKVSGGERTGEWWKTKTAPRFRYWDQHVIAVSEGRQWPTKPQRRPANAPYTIELVWKDIDFGPVALGSPKAVTTYFTYFVFPDKKLRVLDGERLCSPFEPRGFPAIQRGGWKVTTPNRKPGDWAAYHVEAPADDLSFERKRAVRLSGRLLWRYKPNDRRNERLPDDDDLDRLATSAAIEAAF